MAVAAVRIRRRARPGGGRTRWQPAIAAGVMAADAIDAMAKVERDHWWFRAKHRLVLDELRRQRVAGMVVDVGRGHRRAARAAGRGGLPRRRDGARPGRPGPRPGRRAAPAAGAVGRRGACPCAPAAPAAVTALDVLEHLDDDVLALRELGRVVGPGGLVLVAVPAYQWAWSDHDVRLGHRRRYSRARLRAVAEAGRARGAALHALPLVADARRVARAPHAAAAGWPASGSAEEASFGNAWINRLLQLVTDVERTVAGRRDLPVGLSILLVARA